MKSISFSIAKLGNLFDPTQGSRFRRNFVAVAKANFIAQSAVLMATPILTRLYTPAEFGILALFSSALSLLLSFSTFRLEWSIPNTTSRTQAASLLAIGMGHMAIGCLVISVFISSLNTSSLPWESLQALRPFLAFFPIALFFGSLYQLVQSWHIREAQLSIVASAKITQSISGTIFNLMGGLVYASPFYLIFSMIMASLLGSSTLALRANNLKESLLKVSVKRLKVTYIKFWKESVLSTGVSIVNTASLAVTPLLLAQYYSPSEVGLYALMYRLAIVPLGIFSTSIGQSFWSEAAILIKKEKSLLKQLYIKTSKHLLMAAIPVVIVCLSGPLFVGKLFGGRDWNNAGIILTALTPMLVGQIVVSPLSHLVVHRKQHWQFTWDVCRLVAILATVTVLGQAEVQITKLVFSLAVVHLLMYGLIFYLNLLCFKDEELT